MNKDLEIINQLIKEVKQEMKSGIINESKEPVSNKETLNEYVIKNILDIIRESGD